MVMVVVVTMSPKPPSREVVDVSAPALFLILPCWTADVETVLESEDQTGGDVHDVNEKEKRDGRRSLNFISCRRYRYECR